MSPLARSLDAHMLEARERERAARNEEGTFLGERPFSNYLHDARPGATAEVRKSLLLASVCLGGSSETSSRSPK